MKNKIIVILMFVLFISTIPNVFSDSTLGYIKNYPGFISGIYVDFYENYNFDFNQFEWYNFNFIGSNIIGNSNNKTMLNEFKNYHFNNTIYKVDNSKYNFESISCSSKDSQTLMTYEYNSQLYCLKIKDVDSNYLNTPLNYVSIIEGGRVVVEIDLRSTMMGNNNWFIFQTTGSESYRGSQFTIGCNYDKVNFFSHYTIYDENWNYVLNGYRMMTGIFPCNNCLLNSQTILHGDSILTYQSEESDSCISETRTCNNGVLSGSYQYLTCNKPVEETTTGNFIPEIINSGGCLQVKNLFGSLCLESNSIYTYNELNYLLYVDNEENVEYYENFFVLNPSTI